MPYDINSQQIDIENLFKQNANDLSSIKELYRKLKELEEKISQIKYIDSKLADKLKKDYENLKKVILDENIQIELRNNINEVSSQLDTIENIQIELRNNINEVSSQLDTIENNVDLKMGKGESISVSQIDKNRGKLDQTYMTDEFLQQMAGNTPINSVPTDNSITESKLDSSFLKSINKQHIKVFGGITNIIQDKYNFKVTTTSAITIYDKKGRKWSFNGVSDFVLTEQEILIADIENNVPGGPYDLTTLTKPETNVINKIVICGNFYGKFFSDVTLNLQEKLKLIVENKSNIDAYKYFDSIRSSMVAFPHSKNIKITFDKNRNILSTDGTIYIRKATEQVKSIIIPQFEFTMSDYEVIYIDPLDIKSDVAELPLEKIYKGLVYEAFDINKHIPLFWYAHGQIMTSTRLNINTINSNSLPSKLNVALFGDSLTELAKYPEKLQEYTGYNVYDCSFAGSVMAYHNDENYQNLGFMEISKSIVSGDFTKQRTAINSIANGSNKEPNFQTLSTLDFNKVDIIVVLYGTNDWGNGQKIGTINDSKDTKSLVGGMKTGIENILSVYPHIQLYFITPPYREGWTTLRDGKNLKEWGDVICETAELYGFPSLNGVTNLGINEQNRVYYLNADKLHLNNKGDGLIARKVGNFITSR